MNPTPFPEQTELLGASKGWDVALHGECVGLPVWRAGALWQSRWTPTPDELAALNAGGAVTLTVVGSAHPPVMLGVHDPATAAAYEVREPEEVAP